MISEQSQCHWWLWRLNLRSYQNQQHQSHHLLRNPCSLQLLWGWAGSPSRCSAGRIRITNWGEKDQLLACPSYIKSRLMCFNLILRFWPLICSTNSSFSSFLNSYFSAHFLRKQTSISSDDGSLMSFWKSWRDNFNFNLQQMQNAKCTANLINWASRKSDGTERERSQWILW